MKTTKRKVLRISNDKQRAAMSSPLRMEILGIFSDSQALSISDMASLMGKNAGSLYHHVAILEDAGMLRKEGTRLKGKRHEALFQLTFTRLELDSSSESKSDSAHVVKTMGIAFRMAERDLEDALNKRSFHVEGPDRNFVAMRLHLRPSAKQLTKINKHLDAIVKILSEAESKASEHPSDNQHLSLTLALLPIKGRNNNS